MRSAFTLFVFLFLLVSCHEPDRRYTLLRPDESGIDFINSIQESDSLNILKSEYMYNGGGVGIGDLNLDGLQDIIFVANKAAPKVYLNRGDLKFEDISASLVEFTNDGWYSGIVINDINNDGYPDIFLTQTFSNNVKDTVKNSLWINQGIKDGLPSFQNQVIRYGLANTGYTIQTAFLDYDLDGDLDLYCLNRIVDQRIPNTFRPKVKDGTAINNDRLYENLGNGTFSDVTQKAGIVYEGYGFGIAVGDINKDGYPDIYISNDYISNDILYLNQGDKTFRNVTKDLVSYQSRFSMGNDMSDFNNDGYLDIMTLDMMPKDYERKKQTISGNNYLVYLNNRKFDYEPQYVRNMLQMHNGILNGEVVPFSEAGQISGIYDTEWSWSPLFADYDNDGDRDLLITNGVPRDLTDMDFTNFRASARNFTNDPKVMLARVPVVKVSNFAYENAGFLDYRDVTEEWGMKLPSFSNGAAFADLDNDGDLDYVVNNINDPAFVYRNNTDRLPGNHHFIRIMLRGNTNNTQAIGAKLKIWCNGVLQFHEHYTVRGYLSSVDPVIHFGITHSTVDSLQVTWPSGDRQTTLYGVAADQLILIEESDSKPMEENREATEQELLFVEDTVMLDYLHEQEDFIDFLFYQKVIPHKFSQIGPVMAKGDLNGDGLEDLLIGASDIAPAKVYFQQQQGFVEAKIKGLTGDRNCTESDLAILDVDLDGDNDVVAVSGGYSEGDNDDHFLHFMYRNENGKFHREILDLPEFIASVVKPFDYDQDGDMDLFIGSRVKQFEFPFAEKSYLMENIDGEFVLGTELDLGMVTDATWTDVNSDGWKDLIVVREWETPVLLMNGNGKKFRSWIPDSFLEKSGLWYSVAVADFDQDGDDDYLLGNLGLNHRFNISEEYPMHLYAVDIDDNGTIDPIISAYWPDNSGTMREYPVNYWDELISQSPFFRQKFDSFHEFSAGTIGDIISPAMVGEHNHFTIHTSASFMLWNDQEAFTWEKLPRQLQLSPIRSVLHGDFNDDSLMDILVAGNDYSYDVSTGYYDASKGMVLLGSEGGNFQLLLPGQSGIILNGEIQSLLHFDGNEPAIVAGVNREKALVYRIIR